jgi:hypothetical protein
MAGIVFTSLAETPSQGSEEEKDGTTMTEYVGPIETLALRPPSRSRRS